MEKALLYIGSLFRGYPPVVSPIVENIGISRYVRQPQPSAPDDFRILFNVSFFQLHEVEIYTSKTELTVRIKHGRRQDAQGLWMTRDCTYTYELPEKEAKKEIEAHWYENNYLLIQTKSSQKSEEEFEKCFRLVPDRVHTVLMPVVHLDIVKEEIEDISKKCDEALKYIQKQSYDTPSSVENEMDDIFHRSLGFGGVLSSTSVDSKASNEISSSASTGTKSSPSKVPSSASTGTKSSPSKVPSSTSTDAKISNGI